MRKLVLLAGLLLACAPEVLSLSDAGPPPAIGRVPYPQVRGQPLRFRFNLPAPPSAVLHLFFAPAEDPRACAGGLPNLCVRLDHPVEVAAVAVDPDGVTDIEVPWNPALDGARGFFVQAALTHRGTPGAVSPVWRDAIVEPAEDLDHDALSAAAEHAAHTRLDRADTDGGGTLDGQEVADGTDPRDGADDRGLESLCRDGIDDDGDALVDCEDADCEAACVEHDCDDAVDDDADGATDCDDDDCWSPNCVDRTLAWTTTGTSREVDFGHGSPYRAGGGQGFARLYKGSATRTCSWRASAAQSAGWIFSSQSQHRRFTPEPGCDLHPSVLPPVTAALWRSTNWYGPMGPAPRDVPPVSLCRGSSGFASDVGGPTLNAVAWGGCPGNVAPTLAFPDHDGDGYGVSVGLDLRDQANERAFFCGVVPAGYTLLGGDCDDQDPTWSPSTVVVQSGKACYDLSEADRDGDGVSAPTDPDDHDARLWGQEVVCGDGVDNDANSLVDCEDAFCHDTPSCGESSCADRRDNDADGLLDCADEDCWGPGCNTSTIVWRVAARGEGVARLDALHPRQLNPQVLSVDLFDIAGKVRTVGPQGTNTCSWTVDAAHGLEAWALERRFACPSTFYYITQFAADLQRDNVSLAPGCYLDALRLPAVSSTVHAAAFSPTVGLGWYRPMDVTSTSVQAPYSVKHLAFDDLECLATGSCPGPIAPVRYYPDADHDGFGVSDDHDLHGALGGCHYGCAPLPAGVVTVGGDCDDGDAAWSPAVVQLLPGVECSDLTPDDRDGDGVLAPADLDDRDPLVR